MQPGMIYIRKGTIERKGKLLYLTFDYRVNDIDATLIQKDVAIQYEGRMAFIDEILPSGVAGTFHVRIHYMG